MIKFKKKQTKNCHEYKKYKLIVICRYFYQLTKFNKLNLTKAFDVLLIKFSFLIESFVNVHISRYKKKFYHHDKLRRHNYNYIHLRLQYEWQVK